MALLLHAFLAKSIRFRPAPLFSLGLLAAALAVSMGWGANRLLAATLSGSSHAHEIVMTQPSIVPEISPTILSEAELPPPDPGTLARVKERGVLRAGIRSDSPPYAYRNSAGELVGHDIDLLKALALSLGVRLELVVGTYTDLLGWLSASRIDCAAGGLLATGIRSNGFNTVTYQEVSYAVVVPDETLADFQHRLSTSSGAPLKIAIAPPESSSSDLRRTISNRYPRTNLQRLLFESIPSAEDFAGPGATADALLTTAEAGSAFAVIHPRFTMLPIFGKALAADVVLLFEGKDNSLPDFVKNWILENQNLDLMERLENHWILFKHTNKPD